VPREVFTSKALRAGQPGFMTAEREPSCVDPRSLSTGIIFHGQTSLLPLTAVRGCIGNVRVITSAAMKSHPPLAAASIPRLEKSPCYTSPGRCRVVIFSGIFFHVELFLIPKPSRSAVLTGSEREREREREREFVFG